MSKSPRDDLPGEAKSAGELTFEKALAELEKIVNRMEAGELSLEQALASHKRGLELARFCQKRGIYVNAIPHGVVPKGTARLRASVSASHTDEDLNYCAQVLTEGAREIGGILLSDR
jgi:exodeoxyribonuclease VII small subunit